MRNLLAAFAIVLMPMSAWADAPVVVEKSIEASPLKPFPTWMAGAWEAHDGDNISEEFWTPERGELMLGAGRVIWRGILRNFEHTRIRRSLDGSMAFIAQPFGMPPTEFPMVASGPQMIEFANPEHDYPQRIRYWREGKLLKARISLMDGSRVLEWTYKPMGSPE